MNNYFYKVLLPLVIFLFTACSTDSDPDDISDYIYRANGTYIPIKNNNLSINKPPVSTTLCRVWYGVSDRNVELVSINNDGSFVSYVNRKHGASGNINKDTMIVNGKAYYQIMYCGYDKETDCLYMVRRGLNSWLSNAQPTAYFMNDKQLDYSPVFNEQNHTLDLDLICPPNMYWAKVNPESGPKNKQHLLLNEDGLYDESPNERFSLNEKYQWFVNNYPSGFFWIDENNLYLKTSSSCHVYKYHVDKENKRLYIDGVEYYLKSIEKK